MPRDVLHGLFLFLSFAAGDWSPVVLPVGIDERGDVVWQRWANPISRAWERRISLYSHLSTTGLSSAFSEFLGRLMAEKPGESIGHLVQLYVEANGHVLLEPRIVLAAASLESLAWMHGSETMGRPTKDPTGLLERALGEPLHIPAELPHLAAHARDQGWQDGMHAIRVMRNGLVHPGSGKKLFAAPEAARIEAWKLAMYYLDMGILYWLGYDGNILDRIRHRTYWDAAPGPWSHGEPDP